MHFGGLRWKTQDCQDHHQKSLTRHILPLVTAFDFNSQTIVTTRIGLFLFFSSSKFIASLYINRKKNIATIPSIYDHG